MNKNSTISFHLTTVNEAEPIVGALVYIYDMNHELVDTLTTDESGSAGPAAVAAPDVPSSDEFYMEEVPYATYLVKVVASGFIPVVVNGVQAYAGVGSTESVQMNPEPKDHIIKEEIYEIPQPSIQGDTQIDPESIPEENPMQPYILNEVFIPEIITVHLGSPTNTSAKNVNVNFIDYIKNVASSEIYPTWPTNALKANIYAQISFVLNRVFTEWYRSRGYNYDITNHTGYDQCYVHGRNIFDTISVVVDDIFNEYVRKRGALNPYFTEYCNGSTVTCKGMSQWGTVTLAQQGYTPLGILQYYYGYDIEITSTNNFKGIYSSYPGYSLKKTMTDEAVKTVKTELNRIRRNYPAIPAISNDNSYFGNETYNAVVAFQKIFNLTADGIVGKSTWNKLSYLYVAVLKLSELNGEMIPLPEKAPTVVIRYGNENEYVVLAQYFLTVISMYYNEVPPVPQTGYFGDLTLNSVYSFQRAFGLSVDGVVGPLTWKELYNVFLGICNTSGLAVSYPGYALKVGSKGDMVWLMQSYLQKISEYYSIPWITADGVFGNATQNCVREFQKKFNLTADGIIGPTTWDMIIIVRLKIK